MSHTVQVNLTANQCIYIGGVEVNIHDIQTVYVAENGVIEGCTLKPQEQIYAENKAVEARAWGGTQWITSIYEKKSGREQANLPRPNGAWRRQV